MQGRYGTIMFQAVEACVLIATGKPGVARLAAVNTRVCESDHPRGNGALSETEPSPPQ